MNLHKINTPTWWSRQTRKTKLWLAILVSAQPLSALQISMMAEETSAAAAPILTLLTEETITSGALLRKYNWSSTRAGQQVNVISDIIVVDLQNPNVKLDVMTGSQGQFTKKQTVRGMATETKAVAGTNGDFYNTNAEGVPMGPEIAYGKLMSTPQLFTPGYYSFAITKDNKPVIDLFTFQGTIKAKDGAVFPLNGVNKSYYWYESPLNQHSHDNSMFIYTDAWGREDRAIDRNTDLTEVLVTNNTVTQITYGKLPMIAPKDAYILRTEGAGAKFVYEHLKVGDPLVANYGIIPQDPAKVYETSKFKMMIGGQTILVDEGSPAALSRKDVDLAGYRSRTAVGYSKDSRYAYLITVDRSAKSAGMSLADIQQLMIQLGVWKGMNLDGGGSTQMVARPLGETTVQLINQPETSSERRIVNSLGVFSTAPQGKLAGWKLVGNTVLFINESASFVIKPYDEYFNPYSGTLALQWSSSNPIGSFEGNVFKTSAKGSSTLTATVGDVKQTVKVQVVGREDLESLKIMSSSSVLMEGQDIQLSLRVRTKTGIERTISASNFPIEMIGFKGEVNGDVVHVTSLAGSTMGQFIIRYDGFSTMLTLPIGQKKLWADFDKLDRPVIFHSYPAEVTGSVAKVVGLAADAKNNAIQLKYNLTPGSGTKAAYAAFGDAGAGVVLEGQPQTISVNVNGDNSLNMVRAEIVDANGDIKRIELAANINWTGWKTLTADLTSHSMVYPIKLKRLYVATAELGQDERVKVGAIAFDDIHFLYKSDLPQVAKNQVKLTIDKTTLVLNGKNVAIDQAPVIVNGSTMVPIRFVVEDLGGSVKWLDSERKVTVLNNNRLIDLWIGNKMITVNGQWVESLTAPFIMNNRTMVPLRVISENLGWKVTWDELARSVMLE